MPPSINKIKNIINEYFTKDDRIAAVYIHGSFAKNTIHNNSDIDLAILLNKNEKISSLELLNFSTDLDIKLERHIDIGFLSSENLVYSKEVIKNGLRTYCNKENFTMLMEATLLSMYANLQQERKEILNAYSN
jgi:uncharacterized protein